MIFFHVRINNKLPILRWFCVFNDNGRGLRGWNRRSCVVTNDLTGNCWLVNFLCNKGQIRLFDNTYCWKNHIHLQARAAMIIMAAQLSITGSNDPC